MKQHAQDGLKRNNMARGRLRNRRDVRAGSAVGPAAKRAAQALKRLGLLRGGNAEGYWVMSAGRQWAFGPAGTFLQVGGVWTSVIV